MMTSPDDWQYPYGKRQRYHLQHVHLFASNIDATIDFYRKWFDADVKWDGDVAGARNVFMKVGIGALHLYDQQPRGDGKNAVHHLGMQVVGIEELYQRMKAAGLHIPNPIRELGGGGGYFMLGAPDGVVIEIFEPGPLREPVVREYFRFWRLRRRRARAGSTLASSTLAHRNPPFQPPDIFTLAV